MEQALSDGYQMYKLYENLRSELMETLADEDLSYSPGGENMTLGQLCVEIGEIQTSYIQSFITFTQNFDYRIDQDGLYGSVAQLTSWYKALDEDLYKVLDRLTAEDIGSRKIDRGDNFLISPPGQLEIYKEALLIFYGKTAVYLKAMNKSRPQSWVDWIG